MNSLTKYLGLQLSILKDIKIKKCFQQFYEILALHLHLFWANVILNQKSYYYIDHSLEAYKFNRFFRNYNRNSGSMTFNLLPVLVVFIVM